ncbi:MAG: trigger factor [Candidatus Cloacimonadota bacterium]|nr:MAG: trigger factor [Candidatus Cloacimonadota bacterium]
MSSENNHSVTREDLGDSKIKLSVEISKIRVQAANKAVQKQVLKHIKVPGFRRDKTPLPLVKRTVGADRFNQMVQRELLPQVYYEALEQENISPISEVEYEDINLKSDQLNFNASFSVAPDFKLSSYKDLEIGEVKKAEVTDSDLSEFLEDFAKKMAESVDVEEGTKTEDGHWVSLLIKGKIDGEDSKALRHYNVAVTLGENTLYPDFDKNLLGSVKLDRVNFEYTFAEDFENKALAAKTAEFEVKILGHKVQTIPAIDDDLAKKTGAFETLDKLKETITTELLGRKEQEVSGELRKSIQEALLKKIDCDLPERLMNELTQAKLDDLKHEVTQKGESFESYLSAQGKSEDELRVEMNEDSTKELKLSFALTEIARQENFEVHDQEIAYRIDYTSRVLKKNFDEVLEYVESLGRRVLIKAEIMQEKALHFLEAEAKGEDTNAPEHVHDEHCNHGHEHAHEAE